MSEWYALIRHQVGVSNNQFISIRSSGKIDRAIILFMNYFAHLVLSQPTVESAVGNLLGDFAKGVDYQALPAAIAAGLENHRAVDRFTDAHEDILSLRAYFSPQRRRFAGIALDVYFDHLLMRHWHVFDSRPLRAVIDTFYQRMIKGRVLMPNASMRLTTQRMVEHDWFGSYEEVDAVGYALDRIAGRIRYHNQFANAIEEIEANRIKIECRFLSFFPELQAHIGELGIEV